jgi:ring-1,2-phenylacetyl-CoA epoxidase subunit PaaD
MVVDLASKDQVIDWLEDVFDPEVPVLTVNDLGVVRAVEVNGDHIKVTLTPTYTGCPAMDRMASDVKSCLLAKGFSQVDVVLSLSPPWTTDWLSQKGKVKLEQYGIATPVDPLSSPQALFSKSPLVKCPHCHSLDTQMISLFGSTACKALYQCKSCLEPFDYFKCLK